MSTVGMKNSSHFCVKVFNNLEFNEMVFVPFFVRNKEQFCLEINQITMQGRITVWGITMYNYA